MRPKTPKGVKMVLKPVKKAKIQAFAASVSPNRLKKRHPERVGAVEAEFFNGLLGCVDELAE